MAPQVIQVLQPSRPTVRLRSRFLSPAFRISLARNGGERMEQNSQQPSSRFVINLCSLAAPITIPQPRASRLTRFSFFLSHYREADRRQYRLLMGYFASVAEANKWLATLKRVYPQAFVSEAPEVQPDLMSNTQALRILEVGPVGSVSQRADRVSEVNSRTAGHAGAREATGNGAALFANRTPGAGRSRTRCKSSGRANSTWATTTSRTAPACGTCKSK